MPSNPVDDLKTAVSGLLYPSESDEPFEVIDWKGETGAITVDRVRHLTGNDQKIPVTEIEVEDFFAALNEEDSAADFKKLKASIEKHLSDVRVFRFGEVQIAIYIVGRERSGTWIAVRTAATET